MSDERKNKTKLSIPIRDKQGLFFCLKIVSTKAPKEDYFGSSVKWIDISHKLYKKAGIMYLCSDQTSRTWIPA